MFYKNQFAASNYLYNKMKTGRPRLSETEKKDQITAVRLRAEERELVARAAAEKEQTISKWIRETLMHGAAVQLRKA